MEKNNRELQEENRKKAIFSSDILIEPSPMLILDTPVLEDLVGDARKFVDDFISSIENKSQYERLGIQIDKNYLLYGPPGTGKTMSIRVINNHMNSEAREFFKKSRKKKKLEGNIENIEGDYANKLKIMVYEYSIGRMGTPFINLGSRIVQNFFDYVVASSEEYNVPTLAVFDEADTIMSSRKSIYPLHQEDTKILETIMKNLQDIQNHKNIYTIFMSNMPESFDEAAIRAGRIDKKYEIGFPNSESRKLAFQRAIENINKNAGYRVIRDYNPEFLAENSKNFSYADIASVVKSAVELKARALSKTRGDKIISGSINQKGLEVSLKEHKEKFLNEINLERYII